MSVKRRCARALLIVLLVATAAITINDRNASADITCYDFQSQKEAQTILDALPNDPYALDSGWPAPDVLGGGDGEAGNGIACDGERVIPELDSPGNEKYTINEDISKNGRNSLPEGVEQATVKSVVNGAGIQTVENPDPIYVVMSIATPEYEPFADYEGHEVPGQCGAYEASNRINELLPPGTTIWLEIDAAGFYTMYELDRHIWIEVNGRYRLLSEVLVSEGWAVVATERPGTGRGDAASNPPPGSKYRNILRRAESRAISSGVGVWGAC